MGGGAWDGSDLKGAASKKSDRKAYKSRSFNSSPREEEAVAGHVHGWQVARLGPRIRGEWTGRDVLLHAVQRRQTGKGRGSSETERHLAGRAALARRRRTVGEAGLEDQGVEARRAEDVLRPVLGPPVCTLLCVSRRLDAERRTSLPPSALPPSEASCQ